MKNPRNIKKTSAGNPGRVNQILRQTARAVAYITLALGIGAGVASCAHWHQQTAFDCNAKPEGCL